MIIEINEKEIRVVAAALMHYVLKQDDRDLHYDDIEDVYFKFLKIKQKHCEKVETNF
jgi:hypothetical protein